MPRFECPSVEPWIALILLLATSIAFAEDSDRLSPQEAMQRFTVAEGLQVKTFAADPNIASVSNIDVDARGRVWACECVNYRGNNGKRPEGDRILILDDTNGDGVADSSKVFYQGRDIDIAMGLCVIGDKKVIVACTPNILLLEDTDDDDKADKKTVLFTSDGVFQHDHSLHSFVFGPDGRFYGNFGNTGRNLRRADGTPITDRAGNVINDQGKPYHGGMVFRLDSEHNFEVLGHNFRNNYEATVDSFGNVWQSDNDDDGNLAVRLNYIQAGGNYGYLDELTGERWRKFRIGEHPFRGKRHWHQNDPGVVPNVVETGNGAPTGVTVYEGDLLSKAMQNQVIFCDAGPHVVWSMGVTADGAGFRSERIDILRSTDNNFRPIDVAVAPDGSLFVSDWYDPVIGGFRQDDIQRGRIYWIAPRGHTYSHPQYDFSSAAGAAAALRSPNYAARGEAWSQLKSAEEKAEPALQSLLGDSNPRIRARALWLLAQIPGLEDQYISNAIADKSPEVRIVGIRVADLLRRNTLQWIERLVDDPSPRVRAECAILLQHHESEKATELWTRLAIQHDAKDRWYLEALGIGASGKWDACLAAIETMGELSSTARNDLVWRSRGSKTPEMLTKIVAAAKSEDDLRRYIRAFDFQPDSLAKDKSLGRIVFAGTSPEIALAAAQRIATGEISDQLLARIVDLITKAEISRDTVNLIRRHKIADEYPRLMKASCQPEGDLRIEALRTLLDLQQQSMVKQTLEQDTDEVAALAVTLALSQHESSIPLLIPYLLNGEVDLTRRKASARSLARWQPGAETLLQMMEQGELSIELRDAIAGPLLTHRNESVRTRSERLFPGATSKDAQPLPRLAELVALDGDTAAGKSVFGSKQSQCANCHPINGVGKNVGPDLGQVGTKLARSALFEAILYPSAAISHNYENYLVLLDNGQTSTGLLVNQNDKTIQLRDADGNLRTFDKARVDTVQQQATSLMPANLHETMTSQQLVDLVAYLSTLKAAK